MSPVPHVAHMRHISCPHTNESCPICGTYIRMSHVPYVAHPYEWVMSHMLHINHVPYVALTHNGVLSHMWHMCGTYHASYVMSTYEWVMSQVWISHMSPSRHISISHVPHHIPYTLTHSISLPPHPCTSTRAQQHAHTYWLTSLALMRASARTHRVGCRCIFHVHIPIYIYMHMHTYIYINIYTYMYGHT